MYVEHKGVVYFDPVKDFNIHTGYMLPNSFRTTSPPKATQYFEDKKKPKFTKAKTETINPAATVTNEMSA